MAVVIRRYDPRDRAALRQLACDTAARGESVERFFYDRDVFADFLTRYYTEWEPQSLWVAETDGRIVGYLTGCLQTRRYQRVMAWLIDPRATLRAIGRGALWHPDTWRLAQAVLQTCRRGGFKTDPVVQGYPAHMHVNVDRAFRGQRIGGQLVERFLRQAVEAGCPGVHAAVRGDNLSACRFFEQRGFTPLCRHPVVFPEGHRLEPHDTIVYGKRL